MIIATARRWYARWQARKAAKHTSAWDNPVTGTDLLAAMLKRDRKEPLP